MSAAAGRILVVDDEPQILRGLRPGLLAEGYSVETAPDGETALRMLALEPYDLIVLDLGLPDIDGKRVLAMLRDWCVTPVIVLSARQLEGEKIAALDSGADDYVSKPVSLDELMARIRRNLRGRRLEGPLADNFRVGPLEIDSPRRSVRLEGDPVSLTDPEFEVLYALARFAERVVTHRQALTAAWGLSRLHDRQSARALVAHIRHKIERDPGRPRLLMTEPGAGYRMVSEPLDS